MPFLNLENKRILVVEDDEMSYLYLSQLLLIAKGTFIREKTGIGAIRQFIDNPGYDLVLMDIQLPDIDGLQATGEIRKIDTSVPIVAQTASRSPADKDLAINAGCTDVITKPFSMEELYDMISRYMDNDV